VTQCENACQLPTTGTLRHRRGFLAFVQNVMMKSKILDVVEEDIEERFQNLKHKVAAADAGAVRRLQRSGVPYAEAHGALQIMGKIAAIDRSRIVAEKVRWWPAEKRVKFATEEGRDSHPRLFPREPQESKELQTSLRQVEFEMERIKAVSLAR
jgi:hypothetical protein